MNLYLSDLSDDACTVAWRVMREHFGFDVWAYNGPSPWNDLYRKGGMFRIPLHTPAGQRYGEELLAALTGLEIENMPLTWTGTRDDDWVLCTARGEPNWSLDTHTRFFRMGGPVEGMEASIHSIWSVPGIDTDDRAAALLAALVHVGSAYVVER